MDFRDFVKPTSKKIKIAVVIYVMLILLSILHRLAHMIQITGPYIRGELLPVWEIFWSITFVIVWMFPYIVACLLVSDKMRKLLGSFIFIYMMTAVSVAPPVVITVPKSFMFDEKTSSNISAQLSEFGGWSDRIRLMNLPINKSLKIHLVPSGKPNKTLWQSRLERLKMMVEQTSGTNADPLRILTGEDDEVTFEIMSAKSRPGLPSYVDIPISFLKSSNYGTIEPYNGTKISVYVEGELIYSSIVITQHDPIPAGYRITEAYVK